MREEEGEREREGRHVVISFLVSRVYVFIYFVRSTSTERALDTLLSGGWGCLEMWDWKWFWAALKKITLHCLKVCSALNSSWSACMGSLVNLLILQANGVHRPMSLWLDKL